MDTYGENSGAGNYRPGLLDTGDGLTIRELIELPWQALEVWNPLEWAWNYEHEKAYAPVRTYTRAEIAEYERQNPEGHKPSPRTTRRSRGFYDGWENGGDINL